MVKSAENPTIKYVSFNEYDAEGNIAGRVYKGEGNLTFTAYYPYARCEHKFLDDEYYAQFETIHQWKAASGLKETKGTLDSWYNADNMVWKIPVYNPGDLEADYKLYFPYDEENKIFGLLNVSVNDTILGFGSTFARLNEKDAHICVDSHANLIYGVDANFNQTGTLYNKFLTSGEFVKIPLGESIIESNIAPSKLDYEYIYY